MKYSILLCFLVYSSVSLAQEIEFEGVPSKRIQSNANERIVTELTQNEQIEFTVKVIREGDVYFWASRENTPLVKTESGIYITYVAVNGSGYIKTLNPSARAVFIESPQNDQIGQITYIEHLLLGLESITYYGR